MPNERRKNILPQKKSQRLQNERTSRVLVKSRMVVLYILDIIFASSFYRKTMKRRPGNGTIRKGAVLLGFEPIAA